MPPYCQGGCQMHRTRHILRLGAWGLLTAGLAAGFSVAQSPDVGGPPAAAPNSASPNRAVIIAINGTAKLTMSSKKLLRTAYNDKENVARVQSLVNEPNS